MGLDNVVQLNITRAAAAVTRQGFGTVLILGLSASGWGSTRIRTYTDPDQLLEDGFDTNDLEYKQAVTLYSQPLKPIQFKVGRQLAAVAQVTTITPDVSLAAIQAYTVTINGVIFTFTSDASPTAAEVVTGLAALINAGSEPVTASGTSTLVLTSDVGGIGFSLIWTPNLNVVETTPNTGVASDLAQINAIDSDWYGLIYCSRNADSVMQAAAWIEAKRKVFVTASESSDIVTAGSSDIGSRVNAKGYNRTFVVFSMDQESGPEGAWFGNALPRPVGSYTMKFKTLNGIAVDALSDSEYSIAKGKNVNVYTEVAGAGMLEEGVSGSGFFFDDVINIDWIHVNMQADVFQALRDNPKIPYTNAGTAVIESCVSNRLRLATVATILTEDPPYVVTAPLIADQDPADKATRTIGGIKFVGYLAGAAHTIKINGSVLVA